MEILEKIYKICKNIEKLLLKQDQLALVEKLYADLDNSTKQALKNIFVSGDGDAILVKGVAKILSIWDYLEYLAIENKSQEFKNLKKLYDELFKTYQKISNISIQQVNSKYDDEFYTKTPSSPTTGTITKVILDGLVKDGQIIKKAVVKVEK